MRKVVAILMVLALVGAGVGAYLLLTDDSGGESDTSADPGSEFEWGTVEESVLHEGEAADGGDVIQVYFVQEGIIENEMLDASKDCALDYRDAGYASSTCYGFPTSEAFEESEVDLETGGLTKLCWLAFYSIAGERSAGQPAGDQYEAQGCPELPKASSGSDDPTEDGSPAGEESPTDDESPEEEQSEEPDEGNNEGSN